MPIIYGDYDYDVHSIEVDQPTLELVKAGQQINVDGKGFMTEDTGFHIDHWCFNVGGSDSYFWLDNGAEFHFNKIWFE